MEHGPVQVCFVGGALCVPLSFAPTLVTVAACGVRHTA